MIRHVGYIFWEKISSEIVIFLSQRIKMDKFNKKILRQNLEKLKNVLKTIKMVKKRIFHVPEGDNTS